MKQVFMARCVRPIIGAFFALVSLTGCSPDEDTEPTEAVAPPGAVTFTDSVKPIMDAKCATCHYEGGVAPFALSTYADAKLHAEKIRETVAAGTMPPWFASSDCNDYASSRALTSEEIETIVRWVDDGAFDGGAAANALPDDLPTLSRVDYQATMDAAYTPSGEDDHYRCFVVDWPYTEKKFVTGFRGKPGNASIVHHLTTFIVPKVQVAEYEALDAADPEPGYRCFGNAGGSSGLPAWLAFWLPGNTGMDLPEGTGVPVRPGSKLVLQVHYSLSPDTRGQSDKSAMELKIEDSVSRPGIFLPWTDVQWTLNPEKMLIPAGQADVVHAISDEPNDWLTIGTNGLLKPGPLLFYTASLHMHLLGKTVRSSIQRADGSEVCLAENRNWDFHWQDLLVFKNPVRVEPDDKLSLECHWDNSQENQPPGKLTKDVVWGDKSTDEMCFGTYYITSP